MEDRGTPPSQGASPLQMQVPARPSPTYVCAYAAPRPGAPGFVILPPRRIPARGQLSCHAVPCWQAQPWAPSHGLAVGGRINQQLRAVTARLTPRGSLAPLHSSQQTGFPSFCLPALFYGGKQHQQRAAAPGQASSGKAFRLTHFPWASLGRASLPHTPR